MVFKDYCGRIEKTAFFFFSRERGSTLLLGLISLLFLVLMLNRGVYLTLYAASFWGIFLLYAHRREIDWMFALKTACLPLLFCLYVAVTPGAFFKDMPLGETMFLSYVLGFSGAFFCGRRFTYAVGSLLAGLGAGLLVFLLRGFPPEMLWHGRLALFFDHPAVLAFIAGFVFLYLMESAAGHRPREKALLLGGSGFCLGIVAFCASRGTYLALLVSGGFLTFFAFRRYALPVFGAFIVGMALLFAVLPHQSQERLLAAVEHPFQDPTFVSRQPIWDAATAGFEASPWWGNGLRSFLGYHQRFITENAQSLAAKYPLIEKKIANPHNSYIGFLFAYGVIGAVLFLLAVVPALWLSFSAKDYFFPAFFLFYSVYGLFDYPLNRKDGILLLFFPLGFIYGRYIMETLQRRSPAQPQNSH